MVTHSDDYVIKNSAPSDNQKIGDPRDMIPRIIVVTASCVRPATRLDLNDVLRDTFNDERRRESTL